MVVENKKTPGQGTLSRKALTPLFFKFVLKLKTEVKHTVKIRTIAPLLSCTSPQ